jgi:hypothetical protein
VAGARSGDKGGDANVGVWVRAGASAATGKMTGASAATGKTSGASAATEKMAGEQWRWLAHELTVEKLRELLPETSDLPVTRYLLPNLRAVNFVIGGILGKGVAHQARFDPQAKGLGEWLRSRHLDIPEALLS